MQASVARVDGYWIGPVQLADMASPYSATLGHIAPYTRPAHAILITASENISRRRFGLQRRTERNGTERAAPSGQIVAAAHVTGQFQYDPITSVEQRLQRLQ